MNKLFNLPTLLVLITTASVNLSAFASSKPNIVFIFADDLGAHTLSKDGNPLIETPHIDKLAIDGMSFSQGYSNYPTCKPSRAAVLSGQYGPRTSIYRVSNKHRGHEEKIRYQVPDSKTTIANETKTIAEALKEQGYKTAILGKWHLGNNGHSAKDQGFDLSIETKGSHFGAQTIPDLGIAKDTYVPDVLTDKAIDFMGAAKAEKQPFFLYLPYYLIHRPLEAKPEDIEYFEKKVGDKYDKDAKIVAAMTKALDNNVGRVVAALEKLNLSDNTLVVFSSDNGGYKLANNILNGDLRGSKGMVYEGGIRVPYIFKWPNKIAKNTVHDEPIMGVDLYPTFLAAANADKDKDQILDGENLLPLLTAQKANLATRDLYWFYPKWARFNKKRKVWLDNWRNVIRSNNYKLIEYVDTDSYELFDLANDPYEENNLAKSNPEKVELLKAKLSKWKESLDAPIPTENPEFIYKNK
ncbi:sulfatase [Thalassotalea crassostreae]|uniref:sulfatase n=1 Tax=Thalassotalea crassostreae TaxID=1763536 RepID=UPI000839360B|nr:sulfatase [Thalassotalea crassostreae]